MNRRLFALLGGVLLGLWVAFLLAFGLPAPADSWTVAGLTMFPLAGASFVLGGLRERVGPVAWYRFVGVGDVLLGGLQVLYGLASVVRPGGEYAVAMVLLVPGGLVLAFIGVDWFRGGRHLDLSAYESGPLLG